MSYLTHETRGVAGLNKVRVSIEESGRLEEVGRAEVELVSSEELRERPYRGGEAKPTEQTPQFFGMKSESKPSLDRSAKRDIAKDSSQAKGGRGQLSHWLRPGIRVRVVSRRLSEGRTYLRKATVTEAFERGDVGTLKVDGGGYLEGVRSKYLETVLPATGETGVILLGTHTGEVATLLEKNHELGTVSVHLVDELAVLNVSMDHFAAFAPDL